MGSAPPPVDVYLWPDNVAAWQVWQGLQTQWRHSMAGATGLCYASVCAYLDEEGLQGDERQHVWQCIRAAEREVLQVVAERREREADRRSRGMH